jgi:hypothetical protein
LTYDLFFVFSVSEKVNFVSFLTKVTSIRLTGTLVAAVGLALSIYDAGGLYQADVVSSSGGILILVACAMRLGIVPIYQPHLSYSQTKTGLVTMLRFTSIFTVLPILCRIPLTSLSPDIATALSIFSGFASFFALLAGCFQRIPIKKILLYNCHSQYGICLYSERTTTSFHNLGCIHDFIEPAFFFCSIQIQGRSKHCW